MNGRVKLTHDWGIANGAPPGAGCYLRPQGVRGPSPRAYLIHSARLVKSTRQGRYALMCERMRADDIPAGAPVYPVYWYSRNRRSRR